MSIYVFAILGDEQSIIVAAAYTANVSDSEYIFDGAVQFGHDFV
jgi:hypothetical protein